MVGRAGLSMRAERVGRLSTNLPKGHRRCWRCGVVFKWETMRLTDDAPCVDCRAVLKADGDTTRYSTQRSKSNRPTRAESKETEAA